jgi:radical SAM superfamily enzyme YgiQ (UPF0313 family)
VRVVLISTYELGRQPFGLASPAAWLRRAGAEVVAWDLSRQRLDEEAVRDADVVAFYLPMHTATRLALPVMDRVRALAPAARLCAFGVYAPPNAALLRSRGVAAAFGAEFEADLVGFVMEGQPHGARVTARADALADVLSGALPGARPQVARLDFIPPDRTGLPPLSRYATLQDGDARRIAGYTEASRGCRHLCRHCPIVPIYGGQFRVVPVDVVLADIAAQVAAGAEHITFGDPDFFNGPVHALRVVEALHEAFPAVTYDVTIKVEHLLRQAHALSRLAETGCRFVTTAVESTDDRVLEALQKGHTAADFARAVALCEGAGLALSPTFVPFTPWTTMPGYLDLLATVARLGLVESVAPIQYAIRLLLPEGSLLLEVPEVSTRVAGFDPGALMYRWVHADPVVDTVQHEVQALVGRRLGAERTAVFDEIWRLAADTAGIEAAPPGPPPGPRAGRRAPIPYLNEPWYC